MNEMNASQIIDSLGMHDAAVKRLFSLGYHWYDGQWTQEHRSLKKTDAAPTSLAQLGEALGAAQIGVAREIEEPSKEHGVDQTYRRLLDELREVMFQIGNVSKQLGLCVLNQGVNIYYRVELERLRVALATVREYPDFDEGGPLPEMIDQVMSGSPSPMLEKLHELAVASTLAREFEKGRKSKIR